MIPLLLLVTIPTRLAIAWRKYVHIRSKLSPDRTPRTIIVFRLDQLGDLVLTTPLFRELRRLYPIAKITAVVQPQYKAILTTNRHIDEILPLYELPGQSPFRCVRMLASVLWFYWTELRHRRFELPISPRWDVDESLATFLCTLINAGTRVGHSSRSSAAKAKINRGFDAAFDIVSPASSFHHELDRNLEVIGALGGEIKDHRLEICLTDSDRRFAAELLRHHDRQRVLVALGIGGRADGRKWPLDRYADCIARLDRYRKVQPVIVCSGEEDADASSLAKMLTVTPYVLSSVPLRTVCAVLERCDLFLGNDSGPAHLAAAMICPTIVISRHPANGDPTHANSPTRFAPRCAHQRVLQPRYPANGCSESCGSPVPHCILGVPVEQVVGAALELLPMAGRQPTHVWRAFHVSLETRENSTAAGLA